MTQIVRRLDKSHDMTFGRGLADYAVDAEATAQNVRTRLYLVLNEWFLDTSDGTPWLQQIMVKPANFALVDSIIKRRILGTEGVQEIVTYRSSFDSQKRVFSLSCVVKNTYGNLINLDFVKNSI
jgi:hypothetical protein